MKNIYLLLMVCLVTSLRAQVTQPTQPASGPGSNSFVHSDVEIYAQWGTQANGDGFWLYEPKSPKPDSADVIVFIHGLNFYNMKIYGKIITRLVKQGNIVIAPRYQRNDQSSNATFNDSCARGIQRALAELNNPGHVKPRLDHFFILGHSVGGMLTVNMATKYAAYGLPKPKAVFAMQPGAEIAAILLPDYSIMESDIKLLLVVGDDDIIVQQTVGNKLFNETTSVPTSHKNLVLHFADNHGSPGITATHGAPEAPDALLETGETNLFMNFATGGIDAVDYYCYWKLFDALKDCALSGNNCDVAFGDTYAQKFMGNWSDATPVVPLDITPKATAIHDVKNGGIAVKVFPNPANNDLYVELPEFKAGADMQFELMDISGRKVLDGRLNSTFRQFNLNFPAGMYFYRVTDNVNHTFTNGKILIEN